MAIKFRLHEPIEFADCINCDLQATQGNFCEFCRPTPAQTLENETALKWRAGNITLAVATGIVLTLFTVVLWGAK